MILNNSSIILCSVLMSIQLILLLPSLPILKLHKKVIQRAYLHYCYGSRIAYTEPLSCLPSEECLPGGSSVQAYIPYNYVIFTFVVFRNVLLGVDHNLTPRQTLKIKELNEYIVMTQCFII